MAGVSSLLKSAEATRKKIRAQEVAEVAFEWSQSAKTYDNFVDYSKFLEEQANNASDPSEQLRYRKTIDSARSGYISNEIQRQTIAVLEGRSTNSEKYTVMTDLYGQAVENGDYDLAQNLVSQLDSLSIRIQNEAEAAQRVAGTMATNGVKNLKTLVKKMQSGEELIELSDGTVIKPFAMLGKELSAKGETEADYFGELYRTASAMQALVADAYTGATTQEAVDAIENAFGDVITGEKAFQTAGGKLTLQDMELAYRSALANNPLYSITTARNENTGETEFKLEKNKTEDFAWVRNDDGTYQAVETRAKRLDPLQRLDAQITDRGEFISKEGNYSGGTKKIGRNDAFSIKNRLNNLGYDATQNSDGTLKLIAPDGQTYVATIQPDGSVRYFGEPGQYSGGQAGMYELDILKGGVREVAPDESSIFGEQSVFGGQISKASEEGKRIINSLAGITKPIPGLLSPQAQITNLANDFSGRGIPISGSNLQGSSGLLQNAEQKRAIEEERARAATLPQLQASPTFNLNQTPVQQFAQNGAPIKQLTVTKPVIVPNVSVKTPPVTGNVSVTNNAQTGKVTIKKPVATPKLTVR